jgi:hypothetical protein
MVRIALIDNGISKAVFSKLHIAHQIELRTEHTGYDAEYRADSHAAVCATILNKHIPDVQIVSIVLRQNKDNVAIDDWSIIQALDMCLTLDVRIVHLSVGTHNTELYQEFGDCLSQLEAKGIVTVCAGDPRGIITLPAYVSNCISVMYSPLLRHGDILPLVENIGNIDLLVNHVETVEVDGVTVEVGKSSSHSVSYVCAAVANAYKDKSLRQSVVKSGFGINYEHGLYWLNAARIITLSKRQNPVAKELMILDRSTVECVICRTAKEGISEAIQRLDAMGGGESYLICLADDFDDGQEYAKPMRGNHRFSVCQLSAFAQNQLPNTAGVYVLSDYVSVAVPSMTRAQRFQVSAHDVSDDREVLEIIKSIDTEANYVIATDQKHHMLYGYEYVPPQMRHTKSELDKRLREIANAYRVDLIYLLWKKRV